MSGNNPITDGRADSLNAGAAHDTGLYDPDRHDNQIVALYESNAQASAARDALVAAGVASSAVKLVDRSSMEQSGGTAPSPNDGGFWGAVKSLFVPDEEVAGYHHAIDRGHAMLVVTPDRTADRSKIIHVLEGTDPIDFDAKLEEWRQAGYDQSSNPAAAGMAAASMGTAAPKAAPAVNTQSTSAIDNRALKTTAATAEGIDTIKVVEERLRVGKREVAAGAVRIRSYVVERPAEEQVRLHEERLTIERRPVDRAATAADVGAFKERTIEARATSEEAVVSKTTRVVEEIGIRKDVADRTETVKDTVRRTEVEVEDTTGKVSTGTLSTGGKTPNATPGATTSGANTPRK